MERPFGRSRTETSKGRVDILPSIGRYSSARPLYRSLSRERLHDKQPDAEYGTTLRIFNPKTMTWNIFYSCMAEAIRRTARKVDDDIILTENTTKKMRYVFSDIVASSFLWRKERMNEKGEWKTVAKVTANRK